MKRKDFIKQFETERLHLSTGELIAHFSFFFVPCFFLFISIVEYQREGTFTLLIFGISFFAFTIWKLLFLLKFKEVKIKNTSQNFQDAAVATALELDWKIDVKGENSFVAKKYSLSHWEGYRITLLRKDNKVLFSFFPEPSMRSHPFTLGFERKSLNVFKRNLKNAVAERNVISIAQEKIKQRNLKEANESEWSPKNFSKRLIGYFFVAVFFSIGFAGIYFGEWEILLIMIPVIAISIQYLKADFMMIAKKRKSRKTKK